MSDADVQSILRCGQCNKPFDKESTLKRHGYYCRSKKFGRTSRARSCISCARRKARCDNRRPGCSTCTARGIQCHYPGMPARELRNQNGTGSSTTEPVNLVETMYSAFGLPHESAGDNNISFTSALTGEYLDVPVPMINAIGLPNLEENSTAALHGSLNSTEIVRRSRHASRIVKSYRSLKYSPTMSIPPQPTTALRSLISRPCRETTAKTVSNLLMRALNSFTLMIQQENTPPPFVHPQLLSSNIGDNEMEMMLNCINLVRMVGNGRQGSKKLFWRNVKQECERMYHSHGKFSRWELLAAIQALFIYILMRLHEGETEQNNVDSLLVATVTVIAKQLSSIDLSWDMQAALVNYDLEMSWKEWIFEESRRRLSVVYSVLNMLIYFEPSKRCLLQSDLVLAPLPAKKRLWEAEDALQWHLRRESTPQAKADFGLAADGELVELDGGQVYGADLPLTYKSHNDAASKNTNWEEWCSGMDAFGGVVMLAASLQG